jgi:hypothetical protein
VAAKYVILPFKQKYSGELIRLIVQVSSNADAVSAGNGTSLGNQIKITHMMY